MKIRTKLTLRYTAITVTVFTVFAVSVYLFSEWNRERQFFRTLKQEAVTKLNLFVEGNIDEEIMQAIYRNNREFIDEVEVAIYDTDFNLLYHDAIEIDIVKETPEMIEEIIRLGLITFYVGRYQAIGLFYELHGKEYVVTAAAYDGHGHAQQRMLLFLLIGLWFAGILFIVPTGYFLARGALSPVARIVDEVEHISDFNLNTRLEIKDKQDELGELAETFNEMLDRLEKSFDSQKMFVNNISHELQTPLAATIAELELALRRERTSAEYVKIMKNVLADAHRMEDLSKDLLNLARAEYDSAEIAKEEVRLDEALLDARNTIIKNNKDYIVDLIFDKEVDDEKQITVFGNEYLLEIAFINLIENNCKFSENKTSIVSLSFNETHSIIRFSDTGIGMSKNEIGKIFTPFYRGENKAQAEGHGIGMALVQRILILHKGRIFVNSRKNEGTTFEVSLPHL